MRSHPPKGETNETTHAETRQLQRLVISYTRHGVEVRALYRRRSQDGPNPGTKARQREVSDLIRAGLQRALEALGEGDVTMAGTSGFTTREDIMVASVAKSPRQPKEESAA